MKIIDFGLQEYEKTLRQQEEIFEALISAKRSGEKKEEFILIGEHPAVITVGRRGKDSNILASLPSLNEKGIQVYHIGRGGDVTYHCPGQLIVYPVLDLDRLRIGVKEYVNLLEEGVIRTLRAYDIFGERIEGATGIWLGKGTHYERKICAIGIKCSRFCTMHGLALNVNADLKGFGFINPCGFQDKGVTSLNLETQVPVDMGEVKKELLGHLLRLLG